jgi:hypothetical protein
MLAGPMRVGTGIVEGVKMIVGTAQRGKIRE